VVDDDAQATGSEVAIANSGKRCQCVGDGCSGASRVALIAQTVGDLEKRIDSRLGRADLARNCESPIVESG